MGINLLWLLCGLALGGWGGAYWQRRSNQSESIGGAVAQGEPAWVDNRPLNKTPDQQRIEKPMPLHYRQTLELAQLKGGFLARTAHELRSPLSSLMGLHQLILTDLCDSPEEERDCVAQAYEAAQNFHGLLDTLINVSKLDVGRKTLEMQPLDLEMLMNDVTMAVHLPLADRNIRFAIERDRDNDCDNDRDNEPWPQFQADYSCLRQVLIQLILMAADLKATEITCKIVSSAKPGSVGILLRDNRADDAWKESLADWRKIQKNEPFSDAIAPNVLAESSSDASTGISTQKRLEAWQPTTLSPGLSLCVQQSLIQCMGGQLACLNDPSTDMGEATATTPASIEASSITAMDTTTLDTAKTAGDKTASAGLWSEDPDPQDQICCWFEQS